MSAPKLTPPADAPKIPKGWVYMGPKFRSEKPILWAYWNGGDEWYGVDCCIRFKLEPWGGCHYITPAPKRAKKKTTKGNGAVIAKKEMFGGNIMAYVLPADADSVARMVEQAAKALAVADYKDETHAAEAMLAAIGIAGRRK